MYFFAFLQEKARGWAGWGGGTECKRKQVSIIDMYLVFHRDRDWEDEGYGANYLNQRKQFYNWHQSRLAPR